MKWLLGLMLFDSPDCPPGWVDDLPAVVKDGVIRLAYDLGLSHPAAETVDPDYLCGAWFVWRRRYVCRPLPRWLDPVFGK